MVKNLWYDLIDKPKLWFIGLFYCRKYGHQLKMDSHGQCITCGKQVH